MYVEGWALWTICNFCIMWSWANTCDEHLERKILKTIVKRSELCYSPLKNIRMWLWIGWLSHLHRHMHVAVLLLFRRKRNRWHDFPQSQCPQLQTLHPLEDIAPVGLHCHHSKVQWRTRLGVMSPLPAGWIAWCWTQADLATLLLSQRHLLQAAPKCGRSGHTTAYGQRGPCQALPEHWQTSSAQNVNFCALQLLVLVISQLFSRGKHISYQI